jgi:hypothetical protein
MRLEFIKKLAITCCLCCAVYPRVAAASQKMCTYNSYKWNTVTRQVVARERITKPYAELSPQEVDARTGCSVCEQDQVSIELLGLPGFKLCRVLAAEVKTALARLMAQGAPVYQIEGYRVGRTRGSADAAGNRTEFSNHSFGIALDINPQHNGLYENCISWGPSCRLIKGGDWNPEKYRQSLAADSAIVRAMQELGLRWGGGIAGRQKDFMHFSPTGY